MENYFRIIYLTIINFLQGDIMLESLKRIIKSYVLPYKPLLKSKTQWNKEYSDGKWNYLNNTKDSMRYSVIVSFIHDNFNNSITI